MTKSQIPNPNASADEVGENSADSLPATIARWMSDHPKLVLAILTGLMAIQISANWKPDPDGVNYLSIARNLALHGRLQRQGMSHLYYAPGYAILISPAFFFGAFPFAEIGAIQLVFAAVFMLATYKWFARYEPRGAIFITALVMVNVGFWDLFRQTRAEIAFMAALMGSAVFLASAAEARTRRRFILTTAAAVLLVIVMCCIRQVGILLAGGFALTLLARALIHQMTWSRAILGSGVVVMAALTVVIGLMLYDAHTAKQSGPYEVTYFQNRRDPNQSLKFTLIEGIRRQTAEIGRLVLPGMWKSYSRPGLWFTFNTGLYLMVSAVVAVGCWKFTRDTLDPLALAFPFYFILFVVWPFDQGTRFTVPMLPVLAAGIWWLLQPLRANRQTAMVVLIVAHLVVSLGVWARDAAIVRRLNGEWLAMQQVAAEIPVDADVICARDVRPEQWMFLTYLTDRRFIWKSSSEPIPARVGYVISPAQVPDAPGFEGITIVDGLKIQRRIDQGYFVFNWRNPSDSIVR